MEQQVQIAIDARDGNILVAIGPMIKFGMDLKSALGFMAALSTVLAQHPQVQPTTGAIDFDCWLFTSTRWGN